MRDLTIQVRVVHRPGETERAVGIEVDDLNIVLPITDAIRFEEALGRAVSKAINLSAEKAP